MSNVKKLRFDLSDWDFSDDAYEIKDLLEIKADNSLKEFEVSIDLDAVENAIKNAAKDVIRTFFSDSVFSIEIRDDCVLILSDDITGDGYIICDHSKVHFAISESKKDALVKGLNNMTFTKDMIDGQMRDVTEIEDLESLLRSS